jgi:hypothetical protein
MQEKGPQDVIERAFLRNRRMDHVGVVVDDLPAAIAFFTTLGMAREARRRSKAPG